MKKLCVSLVACCILFFLGGAAVMYASVTKKLAWMYVGITGIILGATGYVIILIIVAHRFVKKNRRTEV